jgi:lysophospholipase L1-like esterase
MKRKLSIRLLCFIGLLLLHCNPSEKVITETEILEVKTPEETEKVEEVEAPQTAIKLLALGDSYTIGQSVCETCRFPAQLKSLLETSTDSLNISLNIIAQTGWTTYSLKNAIEISNTTKNQDLVTLLIGVNNQFRSLPFSVFEKEFPELVNTSIQLAGGNKKKIIIISIPDYAFTPFGKGKTSISEGIKQYNDYIETYCKLNNIDYVYVTDITQKGLDNPELVALDGLHPSEKAYAQFALRLLPLATEKLKL